MKYRLILSIMLFIAATVQSYGQKNETAEPRKTAEQRADATLEQMNADLALTAEQQAQIRDILLMKEKKRDAGRLTEDEKKAYKKQIHDILTPEQQKKQQQLKKDQKGNGKNKGEQTKKAPNPTQEQQVTE